MFKRLLAAFLSICIFSFANSVYYYIPESQRDSNVYYSSVWESFIFELYLLGLIFLCLGLPVSLLIERLIKKLNPENPKMRYALYVVLYSLAGASVGFLFSWMEFRNSSAFLGDMVFTLTLYGLILSNLYYHILIAMTALRKR